MRATFILALAACSDLGSVPQPPSPPLPANQQTPPQTGAADMQAWLAQRSYLAWHCEPRFHAGRNPSPHGQNRVCSNDLASSAGAGEFPVGAASVKELGSDGDVMAYTVSVHVAPGGGGSWYWYEGSLSSAAVVGLAQPGCTGCHSQAGQAGRSGHDFVYTQVR